MASPDPGRTPAQGEESASTSPWPLRKLQSFTPGLWSQYKAYEDAVVEGTKGTIADALVLVREHQAGAIGCATVAGFILFRGPRRFLYRNTFGRFKTEKDLLNDAEQSLMDRLRTIPTRQSLELRAEVASMASDLKNQRCALQERINKISEYGVRV